MAKSRPTKKTPSQRSTPSKPSRQKRKQAARKDAKPLTVATSYARQDVLALVALGLLVVVSYLPAMLWGGFVWDDILCIKTDPVRDISGLWQIWFSPGAIENEAHYWPLVYTTFWLEHKLWGFDPTGYHIVNVLLHLANVLLLWHLLRRLAVPGAWMVAAVFAVHPLHVESVAWVIERKDVLSGLFFLAAVLAWMRFVEQPSRGWYAGSLVLYVAGMLSKSIVVTLPVSLLIWHWWKQGRVTSTDLLRLVPFFAVGLAITIGDLSFYWSVSTMSLDYSLIERMLIAARALWFYTGKLLWPTDLAVIYPRWDIHVADPLAWGYLGTAVALVVALWHFRLQIGRGPLVGALFFAVTLSPTLGFVGHGYMEYSFVADRFQYLAGIGVMSVVIGAVTHGVRCFPCLWQKGALGVAAVALVALGMLTWRQASIYRDGETFNRHIIALNPQARNAHRHLSKVLYNLDRYAEALDAARVAIEQRPDYFKTHTTLGEVLIALGRYEEAEKHLRRAIALNPQAQNAHYHLGKALHNLGRYAEALAAYRVVTQRPDDDGLHFNLSMVLNKLGRFEEAEDHLRRTVAINPQKRNVLISLGNTLYKQGQYEAALAAIRVAAEQASDSSATHATLGAILNELGRFEEAEDHLRRAVAINPQAKIAHFNLSDALYNQGRYEEALAAIRIAIEQDSNFFEAHINLSAILNALGRSDEAETHLRRAIERDPQNVDLVRRLAEILMPRGCYEEAVDLIAQALALDPASSQAAELHFFMGQTAQDNGQPEVAAEYYMRTFDIDPHHTQAIRRLAHLRLEQQCYDEALELFQRLTDIDPSDAVAYGNMGIVLLYLGRNDEALESFDHALSLDPTLESAQANRKAVLKAMEGKVSR